MSALWKVEVGAMLATGKIIERKSQGIHGRLEGRGANEKLVL